MTKARKSIATFKLRENMPIGAMVTFVAKECGNFLIAWLTLRTRVRATFRGIQRPFDGKGNCSIGIKEQ